MIEPLPWQDALRGSLLADARAGRLPHAILMQGPDGIGKLACGRWLVAMLLCAHPRDGQPCGGCRGCQLHSAGEHSDWMHLQGRGKSRGISVEQVRAATAFMATTARHPGGWLGSWKLVLCEGAERLSVQAANAMLKTLEEPHPGRLLILTSVRPRMLLATVRSRCRTLAMPVPDAAAARAWLEGRHPGQDLQELLDICTPLLAQRLIAEDRHQERMRVHRGCRALACGDADALSCAAEFGKIEDSDEALQWFFEDMVRFLKQQAARGLAPTAAIHQFSGAFVRTAREKPGAALLWQVLLSGWARATRSYRSAA